MKKLLLVFAVPLLMGSLAVAQTYGQAPDTNAPSSSTNQYGQAPNTSAASPSTNQYGQTAETDISGSAAAAQQQDPSVNDSSQNIEGTELQRAYQREAQSGWDDPNIIKSTNLHEAGGGS